MSTVTRGESPTSKSRDPSRIRTFLPPEKVRFFEVIRVPKVTKVQQELVLVDAGTIKGYRVVYWYLLKDKTRA